jgi:hypothetical protein
MSPRRVTLSIGAALLAACSAVAVRQAAAQQAAQEAVGKRFEQLDRDGDAKVTPDELPAAVIFRRLDLDGDGAIKDVRPPSAAARFGERATYVHDPRGDLAARVGTVTTTDVVLLDRPVAVKATGVMPHQTVIVETRMPEDRWVQAIEVQPGDRNVVHHNLRPRCVRIFRIGPGSRTGSPQQPEVAKSAKARNGFALVKQSERDQPDVAATVRARKRKLLTHPCHQFRPRDPRVVMRAGLCT